MRRFPILLLALALFLPGAARAQEAPADSADEIHRAVEMAEVEKRPSFVDRAAAARLAEEAYPASLRAAGIAGTTVVRLVVDSRGQPVGVRVAEPSGYPDLDQAALKVVRALRFVPAERGGAPHPVWVSFPVAFVPPAGDPDPAPEMRIESPDSLGIYDMVHVDELPVLRNRSEVARQIREHYPRDLLESGVEGRTSVEIVVDTEGNVTSARTVHSNHPGFREAAARIAEKMRFTPARVGGKVVPVRVLLPLTFSRR